MSYRKILVPVDFSSSAKQALSYATFLAEGLGATLHALFVWEPPRVIRADVMLWSETQGTSLVDHAREVAESHMESMFDELGIDKQRRPPHTIETGDPPDAIVEAATMLGITRHALKRRIIKHDIEWPKPKYGPNAVPARRAQATQATQLSRAAQDAVLRTNASANATSDDD